MIKFDFTDKVVLITASSKGIGFGIAKAFYDNGAKVILCGRTESTLQASVEKLSKVKSDRIFSISGDISNLKFLQSLVQEAEKYFDKSIDILINNSGGPPSKQTLSISEEEWKEAIDANLMSVVRLCSLVIPKMKQKKWGRIVNLTSTVAKEPATNMALSNVTRAGVAAFTKTISQDVGSFGITVNTILTGGCLTERFTSLVQKQINKTGENMDEAIRRLASGVPVGYFSTPDEFANLILFLSSKEAGYLTGSAIPFDGGSTKSIF